MRWAFGTVVEVRAKIIRIQGSTEDGRPRFHQKRTDRSPWGRIDDEWDEWPGVALPLEWAEGTEGWQLEPQPNGHPVVRCRRFEFDPTVKGLVIGERHLYEHTLVEGDATRFSGVATSDRRRVDLCEIALPPSGKRGLYKDCTTLILAHPLDVATVPLGHLVAS